jgi:hypothetical protein
MTAHVPSLVLAVLAGPLLAAAVAKLVAPADRLSWPYERGPLAAPWGPRLVGLAELAVVAATVVLPGRFAGVPMAAAYLALAAAAYRLQGQACACFGIARLAAVGRTHVAANTVAALLAAATAALNPDPLPVLRAAGAVTAAALTVAVLLAVDRRAARHTGRTECDEPIVKVRLYVSSSCPACRSLGRLLDGMEEARRTAVERTVLAAGERLPEPLGGLGVPCAVGVDAADRIVCEPASGIGDVKAMVDRISVPAMADSHAG